MIFFTADTHFAHENIIKFCNRPFKDATEMDAELIKRWNLVVGQDDIVYHVGDFAYRTTSDYVRKVREQLNGKITLIQGNHEQAALECQEKFPDTFEEITLYKELKFGKQEIVLFHYGLRTWHHDLRGTWHLYGHSHNRLAAYGKSFDVGVDCEGDYEPLSYERVEARMRYKPIGMHPKFENFTPQEAV